VTSLFVSLLIGGGLGALLGRFGQCSSGACPLTANWKRGAVYGAVLGLLFHLVSSRSGPYEPPKNVKPIAAAEFEAEVIQAGKPVVVDFFAPWCAPCKILAPRLGDLAGEFGDRIKFVSLNFDQSADLVARLNVPGVPTLLFIGKNGRIADAIIGVESVDVMRAKMEMLVALGASNPAKQSELPTPEKL
jgi:thioredoxin 1